VGPGAQLIKRLEQVPSKLRDVAARMAQGIHTSANEVYVLDLVSDNGALITAHSKQLDKDIVLERAAVSSFLQGREIKSYRILSSNKVVIIPYEVRNSTTEFIPEVELKRRFPA